MAVSVRPQPTVRRVASSTTRMRSVPTTTSPVVTAYPGSTKRERCTSV